jgi:hypothetical protein
VRSTDIRLENDTEGGLYCGRRDEGDDDLLDTVTGLDGNLLVARESTINIPRSVSRRIQVTHNEHLVVSLMSAIF